MSTKQPKTTSGHQKKAQNKPDRLEGKEEDASMLTTIEQTPGAVGINGKGNCSPEKMTSAPNLTEF